MLSPIPNACSQAPTHITPPTGAYEVYDFDASTNTAALVGSYGDDGTAAHKAMRRAGNSACIARGGVATTLKGTTPPSHGVRLKAAVKLAWTLASASHEPVTPRPVEPPAAPVAPTTTATPAEEPMPAKTEAAPSCAKCSKYPVALTTAKTHHGTEEWCTHCRRVDAMRRNGTAFGRHAKAPKKAAPAPKAAPKPSKPRVVAPAPQPAPAPASAVTHGATLADGLARVQRHASIVASLGGVEAAEHLAALVADAGGVAVVVEALTTLRGLA
jgi:hypothetical protein